MRFPCCLLLVFCASIGVTATVQADVLSLRNNAASTVPRPTKGMSMSAVEQQFGAPREKHPAVGNPPITRWDYDNFAVFFEYQHVVHAVAKRK
jgi:hypothetical protein